MKEILISIFIVISIIIGDLYTGNLTENNIKKINGSLTKIKELVKEEKKDEIDIKIELMEKEWEEVKENLSFYIEHNDIDKVELQIEELKSNIETEKYEDGIVSVDKCKFLLDHIKEKGKFKLKNIF